MMPSKSSLDRLPKQLSECWEAECTRFEAMLRAQETVPLKAVTVAVSLDGVMVPMKYGGRAQKRDEAEAQGKHTCGPAGHSEVGCGTMSFYDTDGDAYPGDRDRAQATARFNLGQARRWGG